MRRLLLIFALVALAACTGTAADLDPASLTARDLLGVAPDVAVQWTAVQRRSARLVLERSMTSSATTGSNEIAVPLYRASTLHESIVGGFIDLDEDRWRRGEPPLMLASAERVATDEIAVRSPAGAGDRAPDLVLVGWERGERYGWGDLATTRASVLVDLAVRSGARATDQPLEVRPAAQAPFAAVFVETPRMLLVNPVVLAVADADETADAAVARLVVATRSRPEAPVDVRPVIANPYSFYGSVAECAAFERRRCESCLPDACEEPSTRGAPSVNDECAALAADDGRGYFLLCVNVSLSIATVEACVADAVDCPIDPDASNSFDDLADNAAFFDDPTCLDALDECLADIYGEPGDDYPGPGADAGPAPPPRDTETGACGGDNPNCDFSPSCSSPSCSSPSCDSTFDCNSSCSGGDCSGSGCESESGGSGCGGCGGDSDSSSGSCNADCGGNDSGGGCGSSDGGGGGGDCGGGDCGGSGGGSSCNVVGTTRRGVSAPVLIAVLWALAPIIVLGRVRRRERGRRAGRDRGES